MFNASINVSDADLILTEDLDVKSMYHNKNIAILLLNNPFGEIMRILKYKSRWNNNKIIKISQLYKSSEICSVCGNKYHRDKVGL